MQSVFERRPALAVDLEWCGQTALDVLVAARAQDLVDHEADLAVCLEGRRLGPDDLDRPLEDEVELLIAPETRDPLTLVVGLVLSFAVNFVYAKLVGVPKGPNTPQERGDDTSPTFAWNFMQSEYRQGFPVPIVLGLHDVPGQVIYMDVFASSGGTNTGPVEFLRVVLALADGRIEAIGGLTGGALGEFDGLGGFTFETSSGGTIPADIRVNGNRLDATQPRPGAKVWGRMGEITQRPLPSNPFRGVSTTVVVDQDLAEQASTAVATISDAQEISLIACVIYFPGGLYQQDGQGNVGAYPVSFDASWRRQGDTGWTIVGSRAVNPSPPPLAPFGSTFAFEPNPGGTVKGPLEVRLVRQTPSGGAGVVSRATFRQVIYSLNVTFAYPRVALLGLELQATEKVAGGRPNFTVRVKGTKVRVFDGTIGGGAPSTKRYWELPPAGDPYVGIWSYPPGRNPAWLLAEFLTMKPGLGEFITDAMIDWEAIRDWADNCDGDVLTGVVNEARYQLDYVVDAPQSAWDVVLLICQVGNAVPFWRGNKISVKYEFASAHGRGSNSVAAKTRTQLLTTGNVENFQVRYFNNASRPGVIDLQILDGGNDYQQAPVSVQDPLGGFDDPRTIAPLGYTKQAMQLYGVVRKSQARRIGLFMHGVNREIGSEVSFVVPPEALAADLGDVIGVQHDAFRPYDQESFGYRLTEAATASTTVKLDHDVTLAAATTYELVLRQSDGTVALRTITSGAGSYPAGTAITLAAAVTCAKAAVVAFGRQGKVVKDYLIVAVSLTEDLKREVRALEWVPSIYADPNVGTELTGEDSGATIDMSSTFSVQDQALAAKVGAGEVALQPTPEPGRMLVSWTAPAGYGASRARVFLRPTGSANPWVPVGEIRGSSLEVRVTPGQSYDVAVAIADKLGTFAMPDESRIATFVPDEFPPVAVPSVTRGEAEPQGEAIQLTWQPVDSPFLDYYEVRRGSLSWTGAQLVGRTREPRLVVPWPGASTSYVVRARLKSGLYSVRPLVISATWAHAWMLDEHDGAYAAIVLATNGTGTSGLTLNTNEASLEGQAGALHGTWTSNALDSGAFLAEKILALDFYTFQEDLITVDEAVFGVDSGEACWRTVDGRDASLAQPGHEMTEVVDDFAVPIDDVVEDRLCGTYVGQPGHRTFFLAEVAYDLDGDGTVEGPWEVYRPERRTFRAFKVRLTLARIDRTVDAMLFGVGIKTLV
jgi:hypothetical protein